jgi:hypothetical protein
MKISPMKYAVFLQISSQGSSMDRLEESVVANHGPSGKGGRRASRCDTKDCLRETLDKLTRERPTSPVGDMTL